MLQEINKTRNVTGLKEHNRRVGELSLDFAKFINLDQNTCNKIHIAAREHDIGKFYIPPSILNKAGKLTRDEFEIIKKHTIYSYKHLKLRGHSEDICLMTRFHHENFDSSGYPDGLKGKDIPLGAQIIKICDVFDALTHKRAYKESWSPSIAIDILINESNEYDPFILDSFICYNEEIINFKNNTSSQY